MQAYLKPPDDVECPHWRKRMSKACPRCVHWQPIDGTSPNTGESVRGYQCMLNMQAMAALEVAQMVRQLDAKMTVEQVATRDAITQRLDRAAFVAVPAPQMLLEAK